MGQGYSRGQYHCGLEAGHIPADPPLILQPQRLTRGCRCFDKPRDHLLGYYTPQTMFLPGALRACPQQRSRRWTLPRAMHFRMKARAEWHEKHEVHVAGPDCGPVASPCRTSATAWPSASPALPNVSSTNMSKGEHEVGFATSAPTSCWGLAAVNFRRLAQSLGGRSRVERAAAGQADQGKCTKAATGHAGGPRRPTPSSTTATATSWETV